MEQLIMLKKVGDSQQILSVCTFFIFPFIHLYFSLKIDSNLSPELPVHTTRQEKIGHVHFNFHPTFQIISSAHRFEAFHLQLNKGLASYQYLNFFNPILLISSQNACPASYQYPQIRFHSNETLTTCLIFTSIPIHLRTNIVMDPVPLT